jgi:amidase|tara:strand:+ start:1338 stop:2888 length:1551 start_codon:yes stop_codon:yes gene_type:complete
MDLAEKALDRRQFLKLSSTVSLSLALALANKLEAQDMPAEITSISASELSLAIRRKDIRCVEVMQAYLQRIHRYNPLYNAIVSMVDDAALMQQAEQADRALDKGEYWGWMHGMPHAVKDLADARGLESSYGSRIFAGTVATQDSLHIARIRAQGAIFIGKTNTPEFGLGSQSYNEVHGTTRNAYNPSLVAGGSSGGAATGLAAQLLPSADGSDMMGSLRNPAAFNNVVGFRPSQGRVPSPSPQANLYYDQLATNGPMGRTVEDTIRLLDTMAGYDSNAPLSLRDSIPPFSEYHQRDLKGLRIGWMGDYQGYLTTEPGVLELCETALKPLSEHGAVVEACMPQYDMAQLWETWLSLRHWSMSDLKPLYDDPLMRELLKPELVWEIEGSLDMPATRISEAGMNRSNWYRALHQLFEHYDVLALPSAQVFPFSADIHWPTSINGKTMDTYHRWMEAVIGGTLAGLPVVSMPAGFDPQGRPMGIQFMGPVGHDREVLEFAMAYESATAYLDKRPVLQERI